MSNSSHISRRDFVKGASVLSASSLLVNSAAVFSAGPETIKIGLIGCRNRGPRALGNCLDAAKYLGLNTEIVAVADYFMERAINTAEQYNVPQERCYGGIESYKSVMASEADVVLLATPPNFRPIHFDAAVKAGKHVFIEKPVAVDAPGARKIMQTGKLATEKKLAVVAGTQRRHEAAYRQTAYAIDHGAIGQLMSGKVWWCRASMWFNPRQPDESSSDYLMRNWINFTEMSGDHIVEQHLHQLDVANWFIGRPPEMALGFGGRARRESGNQFDFFSVDFDYGQDVHIHSMSRQIDGCYDRIAEYFIGTDGNTWGTGPGPRGYGKSVQLPEFEEHISSLVQEHVNLLRGIVEGNPLNEAQNVAESTLTVIMGRISAYTGSLVRWRELVDQSVGSTWYDFRLTPTAEDFEKGAVEVPDETSIPVPGRA